MTVEFFWSGPCRHQTLCGRGGKGKKHMSAHTQYANDACIGWRGVSGIYFYITQFKPNIDATVLCLNASNKTK